MRLPTLLLAATALTAALPAHAADVLKFGAAPSWVVPQAIPTNAKKTDAPVSVLLSDEQIAFDPGKTTIYHDGAIRIQNSQGLTAAGNIALAWDPSTETVTVNKFHIIRGGKVIDVLASGQTFTTLRRETNLDAATLDGTLTATMQPEDLQEGDIIELATTVERVDPILKDYNQATFASWGVTHIDSAHALISWPQSMNVTFKEWPGTPQARKSVRNGRDVLELSANNLDPVVPPSGAPLRFKVTRFGEATNYESWDQISQLMLPLFEKAAVIPAAGPLHDEVEKIRAASKDPKTRAEQALALVENRVRYVALEMGQGGYVPAPAETTWSRRFADCKAKSALLLGILKSLGIPAEPVLVNVGGGDVIADNLPLLDFNHAIVRAHIGGKSYWLDGTRTGDTDLDRIEVPDFGWVLPLTMNASLVHLVPPPLDKPSDETRLNIDASAGIYSPAPATAETILRGDAAIGFEAGLSSLSDAQQQAFFEHYWTNAFDLLTYKSGTSSYDKAKHELRLSMTGEAKLDWSDGFFHVPESSLGYKPDFDRTAGPLHDAPFAIAYPAYSKVIVSLRLPESMIAGRQSGSADIHETLAGVQYDRATAVSGDTVTTETSSRSLVPEISYANALAAKPRLEALSDRDASIPVPKSYKSTPADASALARQQPQGASDYFVRAGAYIAAHDKTAALADLTAGLALDPKNAWALGQRALIYIQLKRDADAKSDVHAGLATQPNNVVLLDIQGMLASMAGEPDSAMASYDEALQVDPENSQARLARGWLLSNKRDYDGAIREFTALIDQDPKNASALGARAFVYAQKNDIAAAKKDIAAAEAIDPTNSVLTGAKAFIANQQHDPNAVVAIYTSQIATNPKEGSSYFNRASAEYSLRQDDLALKDTQQAITLGFKGAPVRLLRANIFLRRGDHTAVAAEADSMIAENPKDTFAFVSAAKSYAAIGQRDKAMELFARALAIKPAALIYLNRAQVRPFSDSAGRTADLNEALKLEPDNTSALTQKAYNLVGEGKYSEAIPFYDQAIKTDKSVEGAANRAVALYKAGRKADAQQAFADARLNAKNPVQLNDLCWIKATGGVFLESALSDCQDALKSSPDVGGFLDSLGMVLLKLGKLDEALDAYNKAIAKGVGADSLMGRAFVYLKKGDTARAEADAAAARKMYPAIEDVFTEYGLIFNHVPATPKMAATTASK